MNFVNIVLKHIPISKFHENPSSGSRVFHADRRGERHDEANSQFCNCMNVPKEWASTQ